MEVLQATPGPVSENKPVRSPSCHHGFFDLGRESERVFLVGIFVIV
jgi:hypothetical protein